jgi:hypothetical protein
MSVDGVNVVSGETAGWDQVGYVLSAHDGYQITGWRKSDSIVAAFGFTAATNSYAERTGRPQNVGVIGVALFRERPQEPPPLVPPLASNSSPAASSPSPPSADSSARASEPVESARAGGASGGLASNAINSPVAPSLGTAHGEREVSYTYHTTFTRLHTQPDEIVRVRYDSREKLIALGIIPPHLPPPTAPDPFPGSAGSYVPDPPAG